jgi:hypothetical protein
LVEGVIGGAEEGREARQHVDLRRVEWNAGAHGDAGILLRSLEWLMGVVALRAEGMHFGDAGAEALAQSPHLHNLTTLDLNDNEIGDAGAEALRNSPYLRRCKVWGL